MRTTVQISNAPTAVGPYSQAIVQDNLVYTAGQIGINPETGTLEEGVVAQTRQTLKNLNAILTAVGSNLHKAIKVTVYVLDLGDFAEINAVYGEFFTASPPARSTIQAAALPLGALIEIDVIAAIKA